MEEQGERCPESGVCVRILHQGVKILTNFIILLGYCGNILNIPRIFKQHHNIVRIL